MNNLEKINRLTDLISRPIGLLQSPLTSRQSQPDEGQSNFRAEDLSATRAYAHQRLDEAGSLFLIVQTTVPQIKFGLLDSLSAQLTVGCDIPREYPKTQPRHTERSGYKKNGILVHHAGRVITSKDVEEALAEE